MKKIRVRRSRAVEKQIESILSAGDDPAQIAGLLDIEPAQLLAIIEESGLDADKDVMALLQALIRKKERPRKPSRAPKATPTPLDDPKVLWPKKRSAGWAKDIESAYRQFVASDDWESAVCRLSAILPKMVHDKAISSSRTASDIVADLFYATLQTFELNLKRPAELRLEQASKEVEEVWVTAYPFLDLVETAYGGFFETTVEKLNSGARYVFFQLDRAFFDKFIDKLYDAKTRGILKQSVCLDEPADGCQLRCIVGENDLIQFCDAAIWNPNDTERRKILINIGDRIKLSSENGRLRLASKVVMREIPRESTTGAKLLNTLRQHLDEFTANLSKPLQTIVRGAS